MMMTFVLYRSEQFLWSRLHFVTVITIVYYNCYDDEIIIEHEQQQAGGNEDGTATATRNCDGTCKAGSYGTKNEGRRGTDKTEQRRTTDIP